MSRNDTASRKFRLLVEALESRDVPSAVETTFSVTLHGTTVTGEFSTPSTVDPSQEYQSLSLGNLVVKINGSTATISGTPTAEFAYGDLLGVTASASYSGTTVQIDDAIATDGGADAQVGYVSGSATSNSSSGTGGGGSSGMGGGMYTSGSGSISGIVFEDANGNGIFDSGESGVSGVTVELLETSGSVYATTTTDGSGDYSFTDLSNNPYVVEVESTETFTEPGQGTTSTAGSVFDPGTGMAAVSIASGQAITRIDAGLYTPVTVEGTVFVDALESGYFEAPDAVVSGDTVSLENSSGTVLQTASTDSGAYEFSGLAPGTYQVAVGQPLGYTFTTENATDNPAVDSEVNASTGISSTVTLADGASAATINAGLLAESGTASISGTITENITGTDGGLSGVTVQLSDPATGTILQTATTDSNGNYSFSNLVAGNYSVTVVTNANVTGSYFSSTTDTAAVTVTSGQNVTDISTDLVAPEQMTFSIGGYAGSISFSIPWSQVDSTESSQSIALTDFNITIGSQTFYEEGSPEFSTSPSVQFDYGQMEGITFAFDPSGSGLPFNNVSMSGGMGVSAYNTTLDMEETTEAAPPGGFFDIDLSTVTGPVGDAGLIQAGSLTVSVLQPGTGIITAKVNFVRGISRGSLADSIGKALENKGFTVTVKNTNTSNSVLVDCDPTATVAVTITGRNTPPVGTSSEDVTIAFWP